MTVDTGVLQGAPIVDFTGTVASARSLAKFDESFLQLIRAGASRPACVVVVDRAVGGSLREPVVVRDHLNLTGWSPLCGPNDPCGERFPVVQGIYVVDALPGIRQIIAAGLKQGVQPTGEEQSLLQGFGAEACCYNLVPSMLVAAHARCKVLGLLLPEKAEMPADLLKQIRTLTGETA